MSSHKPSQIPATKQKHVFISAVWDISFTHCISSLLKALLIQAKSRKLATMLIKMLNNFHQDYFLLLYWQTSSQNLNYDFICQQSALDGKRVHLQDDIRRLYRVHSLLSSQHTNCFGFTQYAYKLHLLKHGYEIPERFVFVKEAIFYSTQQMKPLKVTVLQIPGI